MAFYALCNHARRFILVTTPKCATTTCKHWFVETLIPSERLPTDDREMQDRIGELCIPLDRLADSEYDGYHVAMIVRDPHRRLVAAYADQFVRRAKSWAFTDHRGDMWPEPCTFRNVLESVADLHRRGIGLQHHLSAQVFDVDVGRVDEFLVMERLDEELAALAARVGYLEHRSFHERTTTYAAAPQHQAMDLTPEWFERSGFPDPRTFYDRSLYELVCEVYRDDVELYRSVPAAEPMQLG